MNAIISVFPTKLKIKTYLKRSVKNAPQFASIKNRFLVHIAQEYCLTFAITHFLNFQNIVHSLNTKWLIFDVVSHQVVGRMSVVDQLVVDDDRIVLVDQLITVVREHDIVGPFKKIIIFIFSTLEIHKHNRQITSFWVVLLRHLKLVSMYASILS